LVLDIENPLRDDPVCFWGTTPVDFWCTSSAHDGLAALGMMKRVEENIFVDLPLPEGMCLEYWPPMP
jgi:hypothetical protein